MQYLVKMAALTKAKHLFDSHWSALVSIIKGSLRLNALVLTRCLLSCRCVQPCSEEAAQPPYTTPRFGAPSSSWWFTHWTLWEKVTNVFSGDNITSAAKLEIKNAQCSLKTGSTYIFGSTTKYVCVNVKVLTSLFSYNLILNFKGLSVMKYFTILT